MKSNEIKKHYLSTNLQYLLDNSDGIASNQKELADAIGVTQTAVSYWVSGKKFPRDETLKKIADYFGVSISDLTEFDYQLKREFDWLEQESLVEQTTIKYTKWKLMQATTDAERDEVLSDFRRIIEDNQKKHALRALSSSPVRTKAIEYDTLLTCYNNLNDEGQSKVRSYAYDLSQNPNYRKSDDE